jgi:hypothetical protein
MNWRQRHKTQELQVGDTVAYSKQFLQSTGSFTGDLPRARGKITALIPVGKEVTLAEIDWNLPDIPARVNVKNLCLASHIAFEL